MGDFWFLIFLIAVAAVFGFEYSHLLNGLLAPVMAALQ